MLISTSRKPSQKTRKFCINLAHATGSTSVNRGKSNMRELLLKALELDEHNLAIVNEIKGNPSRVTFYSNKGEILLIILIGVTTSNERCHILPKNLTRRTILHIIVSIEKEGLYAKISCRRGCCCGCFKKQGLCRRRFFGCRGVFALLDSLQS